MSNISTPKHLNSLEEGALTEWLARYGKTIIYGLVAFVAILILVYRLSTGHAVKAEQEYFQAANDYALFTQEGPTKDSPNTNDAFQRLLTIMARHPELHAAYDGALAQTLLNRGQLAEAKPLAIATLERTKSDDLPMYSQYASASLLISEERYQEALDKSQALQQQMIETIGRQPVAQERSFGDELFAFNLLRIAMLEQQLGDTQAELKTWHIWKQYAALEAAKDLPAKVDAQAFRTVIQQLAIGTLALPDYIAYREKVLTQLKK